MNKGFLPSAYVIFLISFLFIPQAQSADIISRIDIQGNKIVSDASIISKIKVRARQKYNESVINADIKSLIATGFFEDVKVEKNREAEGIVVTFKVKEKPVLKKIVIEGERFIREKKIRDSLEIKEAAFIDEYKLRQASEKIKDLYLAKGFAQVDVDYTFNVNKENEAEVKFIIKEKRVLKVRRIYIDGNSVFSSRRIRRLMKTKKAWFLNRGLFKEDVLNDDLERLKDFYRNEGFIDVEAESLVLEKPKGLYLTIKINEGKRYYIGKISIKGNREITLEKLKGTLELKEGDIFSERKIYADASRLKGVYIDRGYIFSAVDPFSVFNPQTGKVDISYKIVENEFAYVENIDIRGNVRTKDKVIRRELRIYPGEKFDGKKIRKSKERLDNLGFFEEIRIDTEPGTKKNWVDLIMDVKEAKTGYLSFGGGYSSIDELIGFIELRQRNFDYKNFSTFTGAGQDLSVYASTGSLTNRYQLSFTNPWIFDRPVSFGFDGYKKGHTREENVGYAYEEDIRGGALRLGREFNDNLKGGIAYRFENVDISDVTASATQELKDEAGSNNLSSGEVTLSFDTRDNVFVPSKGVYFLNTLGLTGGPFGGDKDFIKYFSRVSFYFPMVKKSVFELKLRAGFADPFSSTSKVPIYERFFAGGASTIRGYHERKVGPIDSATEDPIGGEALFVGNAEYTYPLADFIKAATFFDTGNVWKKNSDFLNGGFKSSIGLGLRVKTPIGPVSLDYGWPLNTEPGEEGKQGRFHFNISRGF